MLPALSLGIFLLGAAGARSEDFPTDLAKWISLDPPVHGSGEWLVANNDFKHEWVVSLQDGPADGPPSR
jgi:hypothetical protein